MAWPLASSIQYKSPGKAANITKRIFAQGEKEHYIEKAMNGPEWNINLS